MKNNILQDKGLNFELIFSFNPNCEIYSNIITVGWVDGEYLRESGIDTGFAEGTNWVVDSEYVPEGYIFIERPGKDYIDKASLKLKKLLTHEYIEAISKLLTRKLEQGNFKEYEYQEAHFLATLIEAFVRWLFKEDYLEDIEKE